MKGKAMQIEPITMWAIQVPLRSDPSVGHLIPASVSATKKGAIDELVGTDTVGKNTRASRWNHWKRSGCKAVRVTVSPMSVSSQNPSDNPRTAGKAGEHD